jgi:hypothetical protein
MVYHMIGHTKNEKPHTVSKSKDKNDANLGITRARKSLANALLANFGAPTFLHRNLYQFESFKLKFKCLILSSRGCREESSCFARALCACKTQ